MGKKLEKVVLTLLATSLVMPASYDSTQMKDAVKPNDAIRLEKPRTTTVEKQSIVIPETFEKIIKFKPAPKKATQEEITQQIREYMYVLHAQNKQTDMLSPFGYSSMFLDSVIQKASGSADDLFIARANALRNITFNLNKLHGDITENTLFELKFELMPNVDYFVKMEEKRGVNEAEKKISKEIGFRLAYMGEKQVNEIIELLKLKVVNSFPTSRREYGLKIADQITNCSGFLGWLKGLNTQGYRGNIPQDTASALEADWLNTLNEQRLK